MKYYQNMNNYLFMQHCQSKHIKAHPWNAERRKLTLLTAAPSLAPNIRNIKPAELGILSGISTCLYQRRRITDHNNSKNKCWRMHCISTINNRWVYARIETKTKVDIQGYINYWYFSKIYRNVYLRNLVWLSDQINKILQFQWVCPFFAHALYFPVHWIIKIFILKCCRLLLYKLAKFHPLTLIGFVDIYKNVQFL